MTKSSWKASTSTYQTSNPLDFARNVLRLLLESGRVISNFMERADESANFGAPAGGLADAAEMTNAVLAAWTKNPASLFEAQTSLFLSYADLYSSAVRRILGEEVLPVVAPEPGDTRFKDVEWSSNPVFDFWKQAYLINAQYAEDLLNRTDGLDPRTRKTIEFQLRLLTSALSPSNFPMTNPEVVRETLATNAKNLVQGIRHLVSDMEKSGDVFTISQTDTHAFEVGRDLATTAGKVIFQNDIFQLIQYAPRTEKVHEVPLLIVPPWINRYYILDLTPQKSFAKFAVDQGFTVFIMSWVNPGARLAQKTFENYLFDGLLLAANAVTRETGIRKGNVLGYCIGGTLVGSALAYLAARDEERFASASFLTTQFDFSKAGDLSNFTSDVQLAAIDELMADRGYLDGSRLSTVFSMMRPKDLIWPYVVNNYLMGKTPPPFDILFWNQDTTRMPAANHAFYLRQFYNLNLLAKGEMVLRGPIPSACSAAPHSGEFCSSEDEILLYLRNLRGRNDPEIDGTGAIGTRLDLGKVRLPIYELATKEDHIAPAISVFKGAQLFGGQVEFVLAGSGHIAGVINPPDKRKYQYWTAVDAPTGTLEEWSARAAEHKGSWWPHWAEWLSKHSGTWTKARDPGARLGVVEDAPGSYVRA
jgi:polyhydroxyalkanoate synthase subunit PhaC